MIALDANITKEGHANMKNTNENLEEEYSGPSKSELKEGPSICRISVKN